MITCGYIIRKKYEKKIIFLHLQSHWRKESDLESDLELKSDPLARGTDPDPHQHVTDAQHWFEVKTSYLLGSGSGSISQRYGSGSAPTCHGSPTLVWGEQLLPAGVQPKDRPGAAGPRPVHSQLHPVLNRKQTFTEQILNRERIKVDNISQQKLLENLNNQQNFYFWHLVVLNSVFGSEYPWIRSDVALIELGHNEISKNLYLRRFSNNCTT